MLDRFKNYPWRTQPTNDGALKLIWEPIQAFFRDSWTWLPSQLQTAWKFYFFGFLFLCCALTLPSAYIRAFVPKWRQEYLRAQMPPAIELRLAANRADGFSDFKDIPADETKGSPRRIIQVTGIEQPENGKLTQGVALVEEGGQTKFSYQLLFDRNSWAYASVDGAMGEGESPIYITAALRSDHLRALLKDSRLILALGLSSSEGSTDIEKQEAVARDRAINLGRALIKLGYVDVPRQKLIGVSLGYADPGLAAGTDLTRQRAMIIIGVDSVARNTNAEEIVDALSIILQGQADNRSVSTLRPDDVPLAAYSQAKNPSKWYISRDGDLHGYVADEWDDLDGGREPDIKAPDAETAQP